MPITINKLKSVIRKILKEGNYIPFNGGGGGFDGGSGFGGGGGKDVNTFKNELSQAVAEFGGISGIESISIIDPNDLDAEYGGIADDVYGELNGDQSQSNVIYNNFGKEPYKDDIFDIFNERGPGALKQLFKWLDVDFEYSEDELFKSADSISAFYVSKNGDHSERQITILFAL